MGSVMPVIYNNGNQIFQTPGQVDTTNLNGRTGVTGNGRNTPFSPSMHLIERFTRVDADTIQYEAALDDPNTWTRPWKIGFTLKQDPKYGMFEYACHEGNNAMRKHAQRSKGD